MALKEAEEEVDWSQNTLEDFSDEEDIGEVVQHMDHMGEDLKYDSKICKEEYLYIGQECGS